MIDNLLRILFIFALIAVAAMLPDAWSHDALCTTDSECMRLCPKSEADCDGGPSVIQVPAPSGYVISPSGTVRRDIRIWV